MPPKQISVCVEKMCLVKLSNENVFVQNEKGSLH